MVTVCLHDVVILCLVLSFGKKYSWIIKNPGCPTPLQELIPPGVNPPDVLGLMPPGLKPDKAHLYKTPGRKGCQKTRDINMRKHVVYTCDVYAV